MAAQKPLQQLILGRIVAPHGVRGWLKVQSFADPPEGLLQYRLWSLRLPGGARSAKQLRGSEWDGRWLRVAFEGIDDRTAAEGLRGGEIEVERASLPAPPACEYYREDLLGFEVRNSAGVLLGTLQHFVDTPGNPVMVVRGTSEHWVPATPLHLLRVLLAQREIEVDWPAEF